MPNSIPLSWYLGISGVLFAMGALGVLIRRNPLIIFMSVELMLNSANLAFVAFARSFSEISRIPNLTGQIFVFFVMTVSAAEVAVGLALIIIIFRNKHSIDVDLMNSLKG